MTDKERENFSSNVRTLRSELGMTQDEFGKFVGAEKQTISNYERGKVVPNVKNLRKVAFGLGYSPRELIGGRI